MLPMPSAQEWCRLPETPVIRLPAMVPRLRICGLPTDQQASASGNPNSRIRLEPAAWLCVTIGPIWIFRSSSMEI